MIISLNLPVLARPLLRGSAGLVFVCGGHRFALAVPTGENKSYGFVIIIQSSAIDFCCKAKTHRSRTRGASLRRQP